MSGGSCRVECIEEGGKSGAGAAEHTMPEQGGRLKGCLSVCLWSRSPLPSLPPLPLLLLLLLELISLRAHGELLQSFALPGAPAAARVVFALGSRRYTVSANCNRGVMTASFIKSLQT